MLCRHCDRYQARRPRGLCWSCYYSPGVRERYPPARPTNRRGVGFGNSRLPAEPTGAPPGTPEKLFVLMDRAAKGQELFHPNDAPIPAETIGVPALAS